MAPRPQLTGFERVSERQAQQALDNINAPLPANFIVHQTGDVIDGLPGDESRHRLESLRQRAHDARSLFEPVFDQIRETRIELDRSRSRLRQLVQPRSVGGYGLSQGDENTPADRQVADVQGIISKYEGELARLSAMEAERAAIWRNVGVLVQRCEDWIRSGRPHGTTLTEVAAIEFDEIVKRDEKVNDALERLRHRLRELAADRHRIESAAYPSADCKARLREQIDTLANRGTPSVDMLIEHNGEIGWPQTTQRHELVAMGTDGSPVRGHATGETFDALGVFVWMHRAALLKAIDALVDSESDDAHALSVTDREVRLAEIERDRLATERMEAALIWSCQIAGQAIEHRADVSVLALLGIELRTVPGGDFLNGAAGVVNVVMPGNEPRT
jgi:hypothetical protein